MGAVLQSLRAAYFNRHAGKADGRGSATATVERYFETCSYKKLLFKEEHNLITTVTMPCSGVALPRHATPCHPMHAYVCVRARIQFNTRRLWCIV